MKIKFWRGRFKKLTQEIMEGSTRQNSDPTKTEIQDKQFKGTLMRND